MRRERKLQFIYIQLIERKRESLWCVFKLILLFSCFENKFIDHKYIYKRCLHGGKTTMLYLNLSGH